MAEEEQLRVLMMVCSDMVTRSKRKKLDIFYDRERGGTVDGV